MKHTHTLSLPLSNSLSLPLSLSLCPSLEISLQIEALQIAALTTQWLYLSARLAVSANFNKDFVGSASVDYLLFSGYVTMGHFWLRMMETAAAKLKANPTGSDAEFYRAKLKTGKFYFAHLLPRTKSLASSMVKHPGSMMSMKEEEFLAR